MKDWTNQKFGQLTVIRFNRIEIRSKSQRRVYLWDCLCVCGNTKSIDICDLKKGGTNSCGCLTSKWISEKRKKPDGIAARNGLLATYKRTCCELRGYEFSLTNEQFFHLLTQNCFYCGKEPSQVKKSKCSYFVYNGVDRVDNSLGYTIDNVVTCCGECNSKKSGITKEMIYQLYHWFEQKKQN